MRPKIILIICLIWFVKSCAKSAKEKNEPIDKNFSELEDLANKHYNQDSYEDASKLFTELIAIDSTNGEYYYKRGYSYGQLEEYDKEEKDYLRSINYNYRLEDSYSNLAYYYMAIHRDSLAILYLNKALEQNPQNETVKSALELYTPKDSLSNL